MTQDSPMQLAYTHVLRSYNPLEIKDILLHGASRKATQHKDADDITTYYANYNEGIHHNLLDANFDGYTVQDAMGSWKSMPEDSKVVIINTNNTDLVKDCAQLYKEMYQQEAVGLFTTATPMEFI